MRHSNCEAGNAAILRPLQGTNETNQAVEVIVRSFSTVAAEFNLTRENAPTHPAFFTADGLAQMVAKGAVWFGAFRDETLVGCVAVERSARRDDVFYVEKLAVLPGHRHGGLGARLVEHACNFCRDRGGRGVSIALMDEHKVLKQWYTELGFRQVRVERYPHLPFGVCFMEKSLPERTP